LLLVTEHPSSQLVASLFRSSTRFLLAAGGVATWLAPWAMGVAGGSSRGRGVGDRGAREAPGSVRMRPARPEPHPPTTNCGRRHRTSSVRSHLALSPTSLLLRSRTYVARSGCLWTLVWVYTSRATARVPLLAHASRALSGTVPLSALPRASSPQSPSGTTTLVHVNLDVLAKARDVPSARRVVVVLLGHLALARNALEL